MVIDAMFLVIIIPRNIYVIHFLSRRLHSIALVFAFHHELK
jgi:hypothetical protein